MCIHCCRNSLSLPQLSSTLETLSCQILTSTQTPPESIPAAKVGRQFYHVSPLSMFCSLSLQSTVVVFSGPLIEAASVRGHRKWMWRMESIKSSPSASQPAQLSGCSAGLRPCLLPLCRHRTDPELLACVLLQLALSQLRTTSNLLEPAGAPAIQPILSSLLTSLKFYMTIGLPGQSNVVSVLAPEAGEYEE